VPAGDPDPDAPYLQAAQTSLLGTGLDPDPDAPFLGSAAQLTGDNVPVGQYTGYATTFADPRDLQRYQAAIARGSSQQRALQVGDNGVGAPRLGGISTPNSYGVAVPTSYLRQHFGNDPAAWRTARAQITYGNQTVQVPFVDVGPGRGPQSRGVITDLTYPLSQGLGTGGRAKVSMSFVPNAGADYTKDPNAWYNEQGQIAQQLGGGGSQVAQIGATPAPTPMPDTSQQDILNDAIRRAQVASSLSNQYPNM
jgi:hypothetical protein